VLLFLLKIGCSLNLENLNSYKGKQALGVEVRFFFFFFFWGEIWKIGCSLNLESFNSYKGKQALGVVEVVFVFMGNLENWVLF
jgi:hypothetical protein